jgi:site-specific recombinase XerD
MATIYKPKGRKNWIIEWVDENGQRHRKSGSSDRSAARRIAADIERETSLRKRGLVDPREEAYRDHERRPLGEHLEDFRRSLLAKNDSIQHARVTAFRARRIIGLAGARRISDLSLSKALDALQTLRTEEGFNQQTLNHYIRAAKGFSRWLWKDRRAREHHLAHLATSNPEVDRRYVRRALTPEEAARVIEAAENGPIVMGMTGADRAALYSVALATGFRPGRELRPLTPECFNLGGDPPTITVTPSYTKNKQAAIQPIPVALADRLAPWLARKAPGRPVFEGMTKRTAEMLRHDLEVAKVPHKTSEGVADFYAARVSYITNLVASGASVKTCQTLARHSTPVLTIGVYAKTSLHDIKGAVEALPDLTPRRPEPLAATGTDGGSAPSTPQSPPQATEAAGGDSSQPSIQSGITNGGSVIAREDLESCRGRAKHAMERRCTLVSTTWR